MFWDAGWNDEKSLLAAADIINKLKQTTPGYWKAGDISAALTKKTRNGKRGRGPFFFA